VRHLAAVSLTLFVAACGQERVQPTEAPVSDPHQFGDLEILTTRSGTGVDRDGYELTINGAVFARMLAEDSLLLVSAPVADYWIGLTGVTTRAIFVVKCDPPDATPRS
jgi:hypothetical protein